MPADPGTPSALRRAAILLLSAWLAMGIAYVSALPPWEGFDETAHYSYLQQLAWTHEVPRRGESFFSKSVEEYGKLAPLPYGPSSNRFTYHSLFEASPDVIASAREAIHGRPASARRYVAGEGVNWQQQHPPLAYVALLPVYLATTPLSWAAHLWSLRVAAYLVAWLSLVLAAAACVTGARSSDDATRGRWHWALVGVCLWPACFPAWFPEMARLGNDAFSAVIVSGIWLTAVWYRTRIVETGPAVLLGVLLGLGCLTKVFFVPVAVGLAAYVGLSASGDAPAGRRAIAVALMLSVAALIAGWWYLENWQTYLTLALSRRTDGLISGLTQRFSVTAWIRGHAALVATVAWAGSWSLARPPYVFFVPLALLVLLSAAAYAASLRRGGWPPVARLPGWLLAPMLGVLTYYVLLRIAFTGEARLAAGYYLHFLAGPLGCALGFGLWTWWPHRAFRWLLHVLVGYAIVFAIGVSWAQLLLFGGIFTKSAQKFYELAAPFPSQLAVLEVFDRLSVLAYPWLGLTCWGIGAGLAAAGLVHARRFASHARSCAA